MTPRLSSWCDLVNRLVADGTRASTNVPIDIAEAYGMGWTPERTAEAVLNSTSHDGRLLHKLTIEKSKGQS